MIYLKWFFLGGRDGWIPECDDIFIGKKKKEADYHSEMNTKHFNEWFLEGLLRGKKMQSS